MLDFFFLIFAVNPVALYFEIHFEISLEQTFLL